MLDLKKKALLSSGKEDASVEVKLSFQYVLLSDCECTSENTYGGKSMKTAVLYAVVDAQGNISVS